MQDTIAQIGHQESGKSCLSKKGSKLSTSSHIINGNQVPSTKKHKKRRRIKPNNTSAYLLNAVVVGNLKKGITNDFINRKHVSSIMLPKTPGSRISMKQQTMSLQDVNSSLLSSKKNGENADEVHKIQKLKKRNKRKRQKNKTELDEAPRLQRRSRYLLIKMKLEQNLIDAYSGEGWKGQSREKIKPERELQRAQKQILKCKLGIRDAICQLELLGSVGSMEDSAIAPDGSVHHEHIICAKCKLREAFPDNDIILCDGTCNCAFHQKCLDPPLPTENIPQGDQGWLCRFCECKMEILEGMNAHLGTHFSVNSSWQDIFKEEAALPDGGIALSNMEADWPSDDSEDDDYDPEKIGKVDTEGVSDDSNSSASLSWSFEREAFSESEMSEGGSTVSKSNCFDLTDSKDFAETDDCKIINGRRQRRAVDYTKLYIEMFGKDAPANEQHSEDEDWGPVKRKQRGKESDAASTLMALCESEKKVSFVETMEVDCKQPQDATTKRPVFRIPSNAVEKLRQVFAQNELPSRSVKESLSEQLGIDSKKINKWFKNARYSSLKIRKVEGSKDHTDDLKESNDISSAHLLPRLKNDQTDDLKESNDTSSATLLCNLKKVCRKKNSQPLTSTSKKLLLRRVLLGSPSNRKKVIMEMSDDICLKKQMQVLKKCKRDKKLANLKAKDNNQDEQMERLCRLTDQIENMKRVLLKLEKRKACELNGAPIPHEQDIIYVPIAMLREK